MQNPLCGCAASEAWNLASPWWAPRPPGSKSQHWVGLHQHAVQMPCLCSSESREPAGSIVSSNYNQTRKEAPASWS